MTWSRGSSEASRSRRSSWSPSMAAQRRLEAIREPGGTRTGELGAARLTISTSRARGDGEDLGGPALAAFAERLGVTVVGTEVILDERELIEGRLRWWCDEGGCELVLTTGGTGFALDDVTPEATRAVIEREAPGIGEAMQAPRRASTPRCGWPRAGSRHARAHADRQLPRQPAGDRAGRGRDRGGSAARAGPAHGPRQASLNGVSTPVGRASVERGPAG